MDIDLGAIRVKLSDENECSGFHTKDVGLALETAKEMDVSLPLLARLQEVYAGCISRGLGEEDFAEVFRGDRDLTFEDIHKRFRHYRFPTIKEEELVALLENLVNRGKLTTTLIEGGPQDGQATWRAVKSVAVRETEGQRMEKVLFFIEEARAKGINVSELRRVVPFGNALLSNALVGLEKIGRIYSVPGKRNSTIYYPKAAQ